MTQTTHPHTARCVRGQGKAGATPKNENPYLLLSTCHNSHLTMVSMTSPSRPPLRLERIARQPRYGRSPPDDAPDNNYKLQRRWTTVGRYLTKRLRDPRSDRALVFCTPHTPSRSGWRGRQRRGPSHLQPVVLWQWVLCWVNALLVVGINVAIGGEGWDG